MLPGYRYWWKLPSQPLQCFNKTIIIQHPHPSVPLKCWHRKITWIRTARWCFFQLVFNNLFSPAIFLSIQATSILMAVLSCPSSSWISWQFFYVLPPYLLPGGGWWAARNCSFVLPHFFLRLRSSEISKPITERFAFIVDQLPVKIRKTVTGFVAHHWSRPFHR